MSKESNNDGTVDELVHQQEFGSCFRIAREAAGLSVYDVAEELKLPEDIIKALEYSQVDVLPPATFTQGYIRSYARLLNLSAEDIVKVYAQLLPEKEKPLSARSVLPIQKTSRDSSVKFVTYSMLLMGFILLVIWWYQTDFDWVENGDKNKTKIEEIKQQEPFVHQNMNADVDEPASPENKQQDNIGLKEEIEVTKQEQDVNNDEVLVEVAKTENNVSDKATDVSVSLNEDALVVSAIADSWMEIQDANNNRLFFELIKKDKTQQLKGKAPFRIFLGNAPAVNVQLNNQSVDISGHVRKNNIAHVIIYKDGSAVNVPRKNKKNESDNQSSTEVQESSFN